MPPRPEELEVTRVTESDLTLEWKIPKTTTKGSKADMFKIRVNEVMEMLHDSIEMRKEGEKSNILKTYRDGQKGWPKVA